MTMSDEPRDAADIKAPLRKLLDEAREFMDPVIGYSWTSDWDERQAGGLIKRLTAAVESFDQDVTRWDEYRRAWHKAEAERDAAHAAGVAEGRRQAWAEGADRADLTNPESVTD